MSEVFGPTYDTSESNSPEAILQFLSEHREGLEGDRRPRRKAGRQRTTALLGLALTALLVGGGVLIWTHVGRSQPASRAAHTISSGTRTGTPQEHAGARPKDRERGTAATKTREPAVSVRRAGAAPWNSGLQPWGHSTARRLPAFYYAWVTSHVSCAQYATYGCWKLDVVSRQGCPGGITAVAQEVQGEVNQGTTWGIGPHANARARVVVELDADRKNVTPRLESLFCRPHS